MVPVRGGAGGGRSRPQGVKFSLERCGFWRLSDAPKDFGGGVGVWSGALGSLDSQKLPNLMSIKELGVSFCYFLRP